MELFPDRAHVRVRNRVHGGYLNAHEDGVSVLLSLQRASLNTAWKVHRVVRNGDPFFLLYGAAYGRYLALAPEPVPSQGHRLVQRVYRDLDQDGILWVAIRAGGERDDVLILHGGHDTRHCSLGVPVAEVDNEDGQSNGAHWVAEGIPLRREPPVLPPSMECRLLVPFRPCGLRRWIRFRRGNRWYERRRMFRFYGRGLSNLTCYLAMVLDEEWSHITVCVRGGSRGRLTPLVIDLPFNQIPMEIVVLTPWSAAALGLRHPDVDAEYDQGF